MNEPVAIMLPWFHEASSWVSCAQCATRLVGRELWRAYQRGVHLEAGVLTVNEWLCRGCASALSPTEAPEWLPVAQLLE